MVARIPGLNLILISACMQFWFVIPKYLNFTIFSKFQYISLYVMTFAALCLWDMSIYLVSAVLCLDQHQYLVLLCLVCVWIICLYTVSSYSVTGYFAPEHGIFYKRFLNMMPTSARCLESACLLKFSLLCCIEEFWNTKLHLLSMW
jgi:hypothetical protein